MQALPSSHEVPSAAGGFEQSPVPVSQVPATWHASDAEQTTGLLPAQTPDWQLSVCVQALASLHDVPSAAGGFEQRPVPVSQVPATWHASDGPHTVGVPPWQTPDWQVSEFVQGLASLQALPLGLFGFKHNPFPSQTPPWWHWSVATHAQPASAAWAPAVVAVEPHPFL